MCIRNGDLKSMVSHYKGSKYPLKEQVNFPNVLICADSLHSKKKVQDKYPSGSFISQRFFCVKLSEKSYILNCWELWKVDMLTIQKLYGLNITPMSKAIWEYKNELPSLHELARSLSEKGKDSLLKCTPEVQTGSGGNFNLTKNSLSWTKLIYIIFSAIQQHHMFSFNVNFNQLTVDFFGLFDAHFLVAALC